MPYHHLFPTFAPLLALLVVIAFIRLTPARKQPPPLSRRIIETNSSAVQMHTGGRLHRIADVAFPTRWLVAKSGATPGSSMAIGTANAIPIGIVPDEPAAGDSSALYAFGVYDGTMKAQAGAAITADSQVCCAANGQLITLPGTTGTYFVVGTALSGTTAAGQEFELQHAYPQKVVVP